ncbi:hypothetical protein JCM24511_10065 [Saitozyma sp. JCM 24511]|nr:hypothetical protein JCM24511_10065 [Saitozyma sp. JCM 24511]
MPIATPIVGRSSPVETNRGSWDLKQLQLEGNEGGPIPLSSLAWLKPLPASASDDELRSAYYRDGVVHITGVMDREKVLDTRERFFSHLAQSGVLKEGSSPREGIFRGGDPSLFAGPGTVTFNTSVQANEYLRLSTEAGRMDFIDNFVHDEDLLRMVKRIKNDWSEPFLFKRQLLRSNIPKSERSSTKVHYDQVFLRGAGPTSLTAWVPIGDISPRSGGLLYLEDSVTLGLEIEDAFTEMNKNLTAEERLSAFNVNMTEQGALTSDAAEFAARHQRRWLAMLYFTTLA